MMALARSSRLRKRRDFETVFRKSRKKQGYFFVLRGHWKRTGPGRAAVVVSKRVSKRAVERNRLKRLALGVIRDSHVLRSPIDLVVSIEPGAKTATRKELRADLQSALETFTI